MEVPAGLLSRCGTNELLTSKGASGSDSGLTGRSIDAPGETVEVGRKDRGVNEYRRKEKKSRVKAKTKKIQKEKNVDYGLSERIT